MLIALAALATAAPAARPDLAIDPRIAPLFAADQGEPRAALLIEDGRVVAKHYAPGYGDSNRFISWSMAKSVTAMLVGAMVADGRIALDAPAPIAEWAGNGDPRHAITPRDLLTMTSGLQHIEVGDPIEHSDTNQVLFVGGTQGMARRAIAKPLVTKPGARFVYSSLTSIILAEMLTRQLTPSTDRRARALAYRRFAEQHLFKPAGVTSAFPEFDGAGTQIGGSIIHMTLDDWGRMGALLLDGKGPDGTQVIAPDWLAFMKTPSRRNPAYGGHVWLNRPGNTEGKSPALFPGQGPETLVSMIGHLGQYVMAFEGTGADGRHHRYVLVRLGKTQDDKLVPVRAALGRVVDRLIPAARNHPPARSGNIDPGALARSIAAACGLPETAVSIDGANKVLLAPPASATEQQIRCTRTLLQRHGLAATPLMAQRQSRNAPSITVTQRPTSAT